MFISNKKQFSSITGCEIMLKHIINNMENIVIDLTTPEKKPKRARVCADDVKNIKSRKIDETCFVPVISTFVKERSKFF